MLFWKFTEKSILDKILPFFISVRNLVIWMYDYEYQFFSQYLEIGSSYKFFLNNSEISEIPSSQHNHVNFNWPLSVPE